MKIAVVGAGIFGVTTALKLSEKHDVDLFDWRSSILSSTSAKNQFRLHEGFHYPRSKDTVIQCQESINAFKEMYRPAVVERKTSYYAISKEDSLVSKDQYDTFLADSYSGNYLKYKESNVESLSPILKPDSIQALYLVEEQSYDSAQLYLECMKMLNRSKVKLKLSTPFSDIERKEYDIVINCTYENINRILDEEDRIELQFELCEKPVVSLNPNFQNKSIVIIDGPFGCIDPYGFEKYWHVLGHVEHAVLDRQVGHFYEPGSDMLRKLHVHTRHLSCRDENTALERIVSGLQRFFIFDGTCVLPKPKSLGERELGPIYHHGSFYAVRAVLPNRDHDDARPSEIIKHSDNLYSIFSGKIGTVVTIADELTKMV